MDSYRIEVGHVHGVQPGNIVGAIANEAGLDGRYIGHIDIRSDHTFIDLPKGMPAEIFRELQKVRVRGEEMRISRVGSKPAHSERAPSQHKPRGPRDANPRVPREAKPRGPREATRTNTPKAPRPSKLKRKLRRAAAKG
jgi:ATP-dependent RNA helicase DeaD